MISTEYYFTVVNQRIVVGKSSYKSILSRTHTVRLLKECQYAKSHFESDNCVCNIMQFSSSFTLFILGSLCVI